MLSEDHKALLRSFNQFNVKFLIIGLAAARIQGSTVVTHDIDLWFENLGSQTFVDALKNIGGFYVPPLTAGMNPPMIGPSKFDIFDIVTTAHGLDSFEKEYENSLIINLDDIPVHILPLERIIQSKRHANRVKDRAVLPELETVLKITKSQK